MWHRRRSRPAQHHPHPDRRPEAPGIPRLRLLRRGPARRWPPGSARAAPRAWPSWKPRSRTPSLQGFTGIAHTRWATHGAPATHNAHPHFSPTEENARIALVHNGIIENHDELRAELTELGYVFTSQTDTEVIAHLVDHMYNGDLFDTVQQAVKRLHGAYAIAVFCREEPHRVVGRAPGLAADRRRRQRRELRRLRRDGAGRHHRPDHLPGRRRRGRPAAGALLDRRRRTAVRSSAK